MSSLLQRLQSILSWRSTVSLVEGQLTSTVPVTPSIRTNHPSVHARSDGEWPTPTGCTVAFSRRASSTICRHCRAVVGANTRVGRHSNVRAQLVKRDKGDLDGTEHASRAMRRSSVSTEARSAVKSSAGARRSSAAKSAAVGTAPSAKGLAILLMREKEEVVTEISRNVFLTGPVARRDGTGCCRGDRCC